MRDLDLTSLRLFVTVCDTGNMSRAAEKANMVASAVSKRLAQLEATVGASLLTRRKHGVVPTPPGETLLEHARSMLLSASRIERDMARQQGLGQLVSLIPKLANPKDLFSLIRPMLTEGVSALPEACRPKLALTP
jgi:DNA-binding transcriptional LysR family regulator